MSETIRHPGVVERVEGRHVRVRIVQASACAVCRVSGACHASEAREKWVDVQTERPYSVGQQVVVAASRRVAARALVLAFGLPFLLMVAVVFAVSRHASETVAALAGLASLVPYYLIIYIARRRIGSRVAFQIE